MKSKTLLQQCQILFRFSEDYLPFIYTWNTFQYFIYDKTW